MRLRSLTVSVLSSFALVPLCGAPAQAVDAALVAKTPIAHTVWKNSQTKRTPFVGPVATPRTAAPAPAPAPTVSPAQAYQDKVLALTNAERTSRGLRPLALSGCADGYANSWAGKLAAAGSLSHQALNPIVSACSAHGAGENVAYGNVSAAEMVRMWMDSPGHRANILNASYTHIGVGTYQTSTGRVYGVQVFLID